jgi:hypothetical protein
VYQAHCDRGMVEVGCVPIGLGGDARARGERQGGRDVVLKHTDCDPS